MPQPETTADRQFCDDVTPPHDWIDETEWDDDTPVCQTCKGTGIVNPLTAPAGFFCTTSTTCPHCEGSGDDDI